MAILKRRNTNCPQICKKIISLAIRKRKENYDYFMYIFNIVENVEKIC